MPRRAALLAALVVLAGACSGGGEGRVPARPTTTPPTSAPVTTTTAGVPVAPGPPAPAGAGCPAVPARATPRADRPRYDLRVDVRPADNLAVGDVTIRFTPDLDTDRLVLRLWPNAPRTAAAGARLEVGGVQVGGRAATTTLENATTLVATTGSALPAGRPVEVAVPWRLTLAGPVNDRVSRIGDAVRLGSFFPLLAWEPGVGWATEPPTGAFAEATTAPAADVTTTVTVPPGFDVLATGTPDGTGRWRATAVPDVAVSVGHFTMASATVHLPHPVQVTVGVQAGVGESPAAYLSRIGPALEDFSARYGPYPWPSYSVAVTPALSGGIEYPMHVLQGPGTGGRTTSHEVAHMWFYGLVGNNQGRDPWLDEGLATWAEARFEGTVDRMRATVVPAAGKGRLGEPMTFWDARRSVYYRSVYVQGAQALAALGDPDRVDCALRLYVARTAFRIARPGDLVEALGAVFPGAAGSLAAYGVRL